MSFVLERFFEHRSEAVGGEGAVRDVVEGLGLGHWGFLGAGESQVKE
jgi:hypothetical protein